MSSTSRALGRFDRLPSAWEGDISRLLWIVTLGSLAVGLGGWLSGTLQGGFIALWAFVLAAVSVTLVLPLPYALVAPLFMGVTGWLLDMLPFLILVGWVTVIVRWAFLFLVRQGLRFEGRWMWLPVALTAWTGLGVFVIARADLKHFLLLLGIQGLSSGTILAVATAVRSVADRERLVNGLLAFVLLMSAGVIAQWFGVNLQGLQHVDVVERAEAAYGLDAFPNERGMIKYARADRSGAPEMRERLGALRAEHPEIPEFSLFQPRFKTFEEYLIVRFEGSARPAAAILEANQIDLLYDSVGLAPANTVPRMRSFPRNALTYAGVSAVLFPLAFLSVWSERRRRRIFGAVAVAACLFGTGFSLARGAWVAAAIGVIFLLAGGGLDRRQKLAILGALIAGALVLTSVYLVKYETDPLTARAGGDASVETRGELYTETVGSLGGLHYLVGYGTQRPRDQGHAIARYVPRAGSHSTYLNYLFRAGIPGLLMIVAIYVLAFLHARAGSRDKRGREGVLLALTAGAVIVAAAHGVILSLYVEPVYTLTISIVLGLAFAGAASLGRSILPWRRG